MGLNDAELTLAGLAVPLSDSVSNWVQLPEVHGWVYDISDGHLIDLKIDVEKDYPEFKDVYKLY